MIRHILLRDFTLQWRLFGGNDWHSRDDTTSSSGHQNNSHRCKSEKYEQEQLKMKKSSGASSTQAIPIPRRKKKEQLLDALLDNYVPKVESFSGPKSVPTSLYTNTRTMVDADMGGVKIEQQSSSPPIRHSFTKRSGRRTEQMIELSLRSIQVRIDNFNELPRTTASHSTTMSHESLASSTFLTIRDFEILDYISTSHIRKLLCFWKSDLSHPREAGTRMATLHLMAVRPGSRLCEEHRMRVKFLPLRINLDQDVLDFLKVFFAPTGDSNTAAGAANQEDDVMLRFNSPNHRVAETSEDLTIGAWFFQSCDIRSCKIKIDYRPQRVNYEALREGDYLEVINLFVLEDMELRLRQVSLSGVDGWPAVAEAVLVSYVSDISRHQVHKCIASVSMPPLRSLANVGAGAADLILLPMEQYEKDRRIIKGIRRGAKSFIKTVTLETLTTASKFARGTQVMLEQVDDVVSLPSSSKSHRHHLKNHHVQQYPHPHPHRRRHTDHYRHHSSRSPNHKSSRSHQNQYRLQPPADAKEGIAQAYSSMSREFSSAVKTIIAVPMVEYQKTGPQGYVKSVIRAVPVAVLRPMIGMSEAVSRTLIGLRNEVDPEKREDLENKFKDNDHAL